MLWLGARRGWPSAWCFALGILFLSLGCGHDDAHSRTALAPKTPVAPRDEITFEDSGVLTAATASRVAIGVRALDGQEVRLELAGDYGDASLAASTLYPLQGRAETTLTTPSQPATFSIFARLSSGAESQLVVSVSAGGFANVRVRATYPGKRPVPTVVSSVLLRSSCKELDKGPIVDGVPIASGPLGQSIMLTDIPAGTPVVVVVRALHYARACAEAGVLEASTSHEVELELRDVTATLIGTDLQATFRVEAQTSDEAGKLDGLVDAVIDDVTQAFAPSDKAESAMLLEAMRSRAPASSFAVFDANRATDGWDAKANTWLAQALPSSTLRAESAALLRSAKGGLWGPLSLRAIGSEAENARVDALRYADVEASLTGLEASGASPWSVDADDTLKMSLDVRYSPARLLDQLASATLPSPNRPHLGDFLAQLADCEGLAALLVSASGGALYPGCATSCATSLCAEGVRARWTHAVDQDIENFGLNVTASARVIVDEFARVSGFDGTWVGTLAGKGQSLAVRGAASGRGL